MRRHVGSIPRLVALRRGFLCLAKISSTGIDIATGAAERIPLADRPDRLELVKSQPF
jgi:hypothetical protein